MASTTPELTQAIDFLKVCTTGTLATVDNEKHPLAATIFFVIDPRNNLVFKSRTGSEHMLALAECESASLSVYDHSSTYQRKSGIQLKGSVRRVELEEDMSAMIDLYSNAFSGAREKFSTPNHHASAAATSTLYRFIPKTYKLLSAKSSRSDMHYQPWQ